MLARVEPRSRVVGFQLLKIDGPNGEFAAGTWAKGLRCGSEPARSRERRADEDEAPPTVSADSGPGDGDLNGV